ncbi:threonine ammonia-lyase [Umezawaea tangerina]|uniref:Threonine dehydratase n=1 Tax=Umezawaea tangerina TaxID=84725 RepID=A0A2T0SKA9_9PSEU|nr:threonine/serine dehydratase [Umezawaea tangerina]PRY33846.1 threonine dehydratase [Umezawaea tangerina]
MVTIEDVRAAADRIAGRVVRTPLLEVERLSDELGSRVFAKAENLQHAGSFKIRGVLNALLRKKERGLLPTGVVTFSAGNHAAATACAGQLLGVRVVVCMPPGAVPAKVDAVRRYGGEIAFTPNLLIDAEALSTERGYPLLHPFDDLDVIAGQGTVGLELVEAGPPPDLVLVPVGGGGLISGVAAAVKALAPQAAVIGVEPVTAPAMSHALRMGGAAPLPIRPVSLADGLAAPFAGIKTFAHVKEYVDEVVEVTEDAIRDAWWSVVDATKLLVEPSAVVGLAAVRSGLVTPPAGGVTVLVLSGGNTGLAALAGSV